MGERELREKYGGKLAKAINRAIRAEVPGGNEALDRLTTLSAEAKNSRWKDRTGRETPEASAYFKHKRDVVDRMDFEVRKRWGVPPDAGLEKGPSSLKKRGAPRKMASRKPTAKAGKPRKTGPPKTADAGTAAPRKRAGPRRGGAA